MQSPLYRNTSIVLLCLLAITTLNYVFRGRVSEAMDSLTWYALLVLFLLEFFKWRGLQSPAILKSVRIVRPLAAIVLVITLVAYIREREWVDAVNLFVWLCVVGLLEVEFRNERFAAAHRTAFNILALVLYGALGLVIVIWLVQGHFIDAWDGVLWLAAFGLLELNLLSANPAGS